MIRIKYVEQAIARNDLVLSCLSLGRQFISHFKKILRNQDNQELVHHWCSEMQSFYDDVKDARLKSNKKIVSKEFLYEYFFLKGSGLSDQFSNEEEAEMYQCVIDLILYNNENVYEAITSVLGLNS